MTDIYEGGCHCGKLRYTCSKKPDVTFYCHCRDCQKMTGGPFSVELMLDKQSFEIEGSKTSYTVIGDSGGTVHRWLHLASLRLAAFHGVAELAENLRMQEYFGCSQARAAYVRVR